MQYNFLEIALFIFQKGSVSHINDVIDINDVTCDYTNDIYDQRSLLIPSKPCNIKTHGSVSCGPRSRRATP